MVFTPYKPVGKETQSWYEQQWCDRQKSDADGGGHQNHHADR